MKHVFIINPMAGRTNAAVALAPHIRTEAEKLGLTAEFACTEYVGHAIALAEKYAADGEAVRLYACGGDGTLNEVLTGSYRYPNAEVAHIPCGSGNDMVRNFGGAKDFLDLESLMLGQSKQIDLIQVGNRVAGSICAAGLDAKVAYNIPKLRRIPLCGGSMAYDLSLAKCLLEPVGYHWRIEADGRVYEDNFILTAIGNGSYYGGGYYSVPGAKMDDGLLNVVLVRKMPLLRMASVLGQYKNGAHIADGKIIPALNDVMETFAAKDITISCAKKFIYTIDGECAPVHTLHAKVLPAAARFVIPAKLLPSSAL